MDTLSESEVISSTLAMECFSQLLLAAQNNCWSRLESLFVVLLAAVRVPESWDGMGLGWELQPGR